MEVSSTNNQTHQQLPSEENSKIGVLPIKLFNQILSYLDSHADFHASQVNSLWNRSIKQKHVQNAFLLNSIDEIKMKQVMYNDWNEIKDGHNITKNIPVFHAGKHMTVFEHAKYPGLIFKLPGLEEARSMLVNVETCKNIVKHHNLHHCVVPHTKVLVLEDAPKDEYSLEGGHGLFVMQRVDGIISPSESREVSERAYEKFESSSQLKRKWEEYFRQAAEFICLTGYWDTSWRNILLMKDGFGFVDFENVEPTKGNILCGVTRLIEMAPPEFTEMIVGIAEKYQIRASSISNFLRCKDIEHLKQRIREELSLRSKVRQWHKEKGIVEASKKCDRNVWPEGSFERKLIKKSNDSIHHAENLPYYAGCLIEQRKLHWQPFGEQTYYKDRNSFEKALKNLQENGIVCTWTTKENNFQPHLVGYEIYF